MKTRPSKPLRLKVILPLGALVVAILFFREPLRRQITQSATLANQAPSPELVEEIIGQSPDRVGAIVAAWNTGRIVQREVAIREIGNLFNKGKSLSPELESIALAGTLDVDSNVRESALGILANANHPALAPLSAAQLADPDPQIRILGLDHLKPVDARIGVPIVIPLLDENDPFMVSMALKLLEHWSEQKFGVMLSDTASVENEKTGLKEFPEGSHEKARAGAARAKTWFAQHHDDYPPVHLEIPQEIDRSRNARRVEDFSLRALDGHEVRLLDFRGKVVLINFWTTWCTACVSEMPELIALQKRHGDKLAIIGVSLDFVPDSHGHIGSHAAVEEQDGDEGGKSDHNQATLSKVREKVARTVKARGINYTIVLDEKNEIGGRFNGGELPTTVIVDAQGRLRRRFIGARSLAVFETMIADANQSAPSSEHLSLK